MSFTSFSHSHKRFFNVLIVWPLQMPCGSLYLPGHPYVSVLPRFICWTVSFLDGPCPQVAHWGCTSVRVLKRLVGTGNLIIVLERQLLLRAATIEFTGENKSGRTEIGPNIIKCCHRLQRLQYLWSVLQTNLIKPVLASA